MSSTDPATVSDDTAKPTPPPANSGPGATDDGPEQFPADHPLVKALTAQKDEIKALKDKARRLDEIEESQKTEAQRTADELAKVRADAETARAELLRYRTAAAHGITDAEDIELFLTGKDEETLTRQAKALAARSAAASSPRAPKPDANQGRSGTSSASTEEQFAGFVSQHLN